MATENIINTLSSFILNPKSIEIMRNNPKLVKMLTNTKTLPSALRLYIRNIAGVTDKITEDFFSKSELAEIKKRVVDADVKGSMGRVRTSGMDQYIPSLIGTNRGAIGYDDSNFSVKGIFTDPNVNMDMTLGQAVFTRDKKGNIVVNDIHDFHGQGSIGTSYDDTDMSNLENEYRKGFPDRKKEFRPDPYSAETGRFTEEEKQNPFLIALKGRSGSYVDETDKEMKIRAQKAFEDGDISAAGHARIIAQLDQDDKGIPIEIDIGKITQKDKYEARPDFAKYIAQDTGGKFFYEEDGKQIEYPNPGIEYEDVGIPSKIRKQAQKYVNQNMATGGRVGYALGSPEPLEINDREKTIAFDLFQRLKDIEEQYTGERIVGDPSSLNLDTGDKGQETLMADASTEMDQAPDSFLRPRRYDIIQAKELPAETLEDFDVTFRKPNATGGRVMLKRGTGDTSPVKTGKYKYPITNRFGTVYSQFSRGNQFTETMRTIEEVQKAINNAPKKFVKGKEVPLTRKDLVGQGEYYKNKIVTKNELKRFKKDLKIPSVGKPRIYEKTQGNIVRESKIKPAQGGEISIRGGKEIGKNFSHVYPIIKSAKPGTKTTFTIDADKNAKLIGYNQIGQDIAEKQELLIKNKPEGYKKEILVNNAKAKKNAMDAVKDLGKGYKGQIGYFQVNPDTGEFKPKAGNYKMSFAGIEGENKIFKDMTGKERKNFERKISAIEKAKTIPGVTTADKIARPEKALVKESFKRLSKPGIMGALKASRFLPVVGAIATPALAAYGLYDAYKKGYTRPDELLASAAFGSGVSLKDKIKYAKSKEPEDKDGLASLMA